MTAAAKKHFELRMVAGLLQAIGADDAVLESSESPDVLVRLEGRSIGVEVTEIQKSPKERQLRAPKDDILQRARQLYEGRAQQQISVMVSFHPYADLRGVDRASFSGELAEFLRTRSLGLDFDFQVVAGDDMPADLRRCIREIRHWPEPVRGGWQCSEACWVAPLTRDVLQARVDAKARRLADYQTKGVDACWLLICAHPLNPACRFEAGRDFDPAAVVSPFDRTFFYDCWQMFELGCSGALTG